MCGRYAFYTDPENAELTKIIELVSKKYGEGKVPNGEIFPSNIAPALLSENNNGIGAELLTWGFLHYDKKNLIINARAESASEKRIFAKSLASKRCVIPSTGFYEWNSHKQAPEKQKYLFTLPDEDMLYMAGLYNESEDGKKFVILTTSANETMKEIHSRMPLVLKKSFLKAWLYDDNFALFYLTQAPPVLMKRAV